jgi:hypothetical protein
MKKNIVKNLAGILLMLFIQQVTMFGQNSWENKYTIAYGNKIYLFGIEALPQFFITTYYDSDTTSKIIRKDTIYNIIDKEALDVVVLSCIVKTGSGRDVKESIIIAKDVSAKLYGSYQNRQISELKLRLLLLENDKGLDIGILGLKKASVNAYLISRRRTDRQAIKIQYLNSGCLNRACVVRTLMHKQKKKYRLSIDSIKKGNIPVLIDSIDISFENGIIKDILVRAHSLKKDTIVNDSIFYFSNLGYIPIRNAQDIDALLCKGKNYLSFLYSNDSILTLDLADILNYNRKVSFSSGTYIPNDTVVTITNEKNKIVRLHKPSISESFDIRIYTDALGYSGKTPNGIIQSELQLNFSLNQGKNRFTLYRIWKKPEFYKNKPMHRYQLLIFNNISPYIKFTKIEKDNNKLAIPNDSEKGDLMDIFKYAHLNVGTMLNLLTYRTDSKLFSFNIAGGILRTTVGNDSVEKNNKDVSTIYINPCLDFKFFESNKIDFNLSFGAHGAWEISELDSATLANAKVKIKEYAFSKNNYWVEFTQGINLHPVGNKQNSVFIRASQYLSAKNQYFTFQIGYSTSLSNLLKL